MNQAVVLDLHAGGRALKLTIIRASEPMGSQRYYDVRVDAVAPPFLGSFEVYAPDLITLHHLLARLYATLSPSNDFEWGSLEGQLSLRFEVDHAGHITVTIRLSDMCPADTMLQYVIRVDQSYLPALFDQLETGLRAHGLWIP